MENISKDMTPIKERPKRICKANVFYQPENNLYDNDLKAALKKSMVEKKLTNTCYSKDLNDIPAVQPSEEVFNDPITLFEKYQDLGNKYGAIKLIPPEGWKPPFSLDLDAMKFQVREQHIHQLSAGKSFSHPEETWDMKAFAEEDKRILKKHLNEENPTVEEIEDEYWRIVEYGNEPVTVLYAADLKTNTHGSGFPNDVESPYTTHPWNLQRLPYTDGSLLKYYHRDVPGITSPWLYLGMTFSCFCWHTEDNFFASVNYQHFGASKVWYVVPPSRAAAVERLLRNYAATLSPDDALHSLTVQLTPSILRSNKIPVYRCAQNSNEFVLLWPRTFHAGFNAGLNCNEACNLAPAFWMDFGYRSIHSYRYLRPSCIPFYQLVVQCIACYKDLDLSSLYYVCKYLLQYHYDEFISRKGLNIPQLPMHFNRTDIDTIGSKDDSAYRELSSLTKELLLITSKPLSICNSDETLFKDCAAVAKIPSKDCDNCQTSCFTGCIICPHLTTVYCSHCLEAMECGCQQKIYLYRYPLSVIQRIVEVVVSHYIELVKTKNCENRLEEEILFKNFRYFAEHALHIEELMGVKCLDSSDLTSWNDMIRIDSYDKCEKLLQRPVKFPRVSKQRETKKTPNRRATKSSNDEILRSPILEGGVKDAAEAAFIRLNPPAAACSDNCSVPFVQQASWKYILLSARAEITEDDNQYLPCFEIATEGS